MGMTEIAATASLVNNAFYNARAGVSFKVLPFSGEISKLSKKRNKAKKNRERMQKESRRRNRK